MFDKAVKVLRCTGLTKSFGGVRVLKDFSIVFSNKNIARVGIIGPNGAGKTTLFNILTGFLRPESGRCFFGKHEITHLRPYQIAQLGVVRTFQDLRLILQIPVLENVLLGCPRQHGERILRAISRFGVGKEEAQNRKDAMQFLDFVGLENKASVLAGELSYGQQKLLALACCLATRAQVLLLDEPVAGVHPEMALRILDLLRELQTEGKLVIFIEHDISAIRQAADEVIVMDNGQLIAQGKPSEVLERPEIMEAYLA